ncbi:MAG: hypothetical protein HDT30_02280 [Clostridiales bacterium]|nr:hypothetical protein [Clostridiales bacterium]
MRKKLVCALIGIVVILSIVAFFIIRRENSQLRDKFFIYKGNQYLAYSSTEDEIGINILIVDSIGNKEKFETNKAQLQMIHENGSAILPEEYKVEELDSNSLYSLYKLDICLHNDGKTGTSRYNQIEIDGKRYDIGNVVIDVIKEKEENNLVISTSPYAVDNSGFTLYMTNNGNAEVKAICAEYDLEGDGKYTTCDLGNQKVEKELDLSFGIKTNDKKSIINNYSLRPRIKISIDGKEKYILPPVTTEYLLSISKEDIINYINEEL